MVHHRKYPLFYLSPLLWGQGHTKCSSVPSTYYDLLSLKLLCPMVKEKKHLQEITCGPVPSKSYNLCTCKLKVATSTILKEMHLQESEGHTNCSVPSTSCGLTIKEMHLQDNTYSNFDLDLEVKVI